MRLSLQRIARSPRLRAMAVLAWLMLVMHTVAANPLAAMGLASPHAQAMSASGLSMPMAGGHAASAMKMPANGSHACCDEGARHAVPDAACHCAAMSGGLLPSLPSIPRPAAMASSYARPLVPGTPASHAAPPLRPPAA